MYTALVLSEISIRLLKLYMDPDLMKNYDEVICHHMTINMGACKTPDELGKEYAIQVIGLAMDEKVIAVKVDTNCKSSNAIKHITVAVNRSKGGKPFLSNMLTSWESSIGPMLTGTVQECQ